MDEDLKLFCESLEGEKNALGKMFENYRHGTLNESDFQKALRRATKFLVEKKEFVWQEKQKLENLVNTASRKTFKCLTDTFIRYSEAYEAAYRASLHNTKEKTNICYQKVRESFVLLLQIANFIAGYRDYDEVKTRFVTLKKKIGTKRLLDLLTIQTTESLFRQVDEFWSKSVYEEGKIVLQICLRRLSDLLQQASENDKQEELKKRLKKIYRLGEQAEEFTSDKKIVDFKEVAAIQNLVKNGFFVLAERLVCDLEYIFAPCRIFFQEYESYLNFSQGEVLRVIPPDELRSLILDRGWDSATYKLSEAKLKVHMEKLTLLNFQTSVNNRKIAEKLKTESVDLNQPPQK